MVLNGVFFALRLNGITHLRRHDIRHIATRKLRGLKSWLMLSVNLAVTIQL